MNNPFLLTSPYDGTQYLTSRCSLNRAVLQKLPLYGIEDGLEGLKYNQIFSTRLIVEEIRRIARFFALDLSDTPDAMLPRILDRALVSDDIRYRKMAEQVARKFGSRLGLLLLALKRGEEPNRLARPEWDDGCWQFWHDVGTLILTGGLASSMLGRRFKEYIYNVFDMAGERPYQVVLFENGAYLGEMGVAQRLMCDDTAALVLDLGHTNFKRAVVRKSGGIITEFTAMESKPSMYMQSAFGSDAERRAVAVDLHRFIVNFIADSYREGSIKAELCDTILISIASYTHSGVLDSEHGGYAKLSMLGANYASVLEEELSGELHHRVRVRLVHDGTATALYFSDIDDAVCITLGTGFGVGFPDIRL